MRNGWPRFKNALRNGQSLRTEFEHDLRLKMWCKTAKKDICHVMWLSPRSAFLLPNASKNWCLKKRKRSSYLMVLNLRAISSASYTAQRTGSVMWGLVNNVKGSVGDRP